MGQTAGLETHELAVADEVFEVKHQTAAKADYPQGLSPGGSVKTL